MSEAAFQLLKEICQLTLVLHALASPCLALGLPPILDLPLPRFKFALQRDFELDAAAICNCKLHFSRKTVTWANFQIAQVWMRNFHLFCDIYRGMRKELRGRTQTTWPFLGHFLTPLVTCDISWFFEGPPPNVTCFS